MSLKLRKQTMSLLATMISNMNSASCKPLSDIFNSMFYDLKLRGKCWKTILYVKFISKVILATNAIKTFSGIFKL